jgi:hypothetical protein
MPPVAVPNAGATALAMAPRALFKSIIPAPTAPSAAPVATAVDVTVSSDYSPDLAEGLEHGRSEQETTEPAPELALSRYQLWRTCRSGIIAGLKRRHQLRQAAMITSDKNRREQRLLEVLGERQIALNLGNQPRTLQSRDYKVGHIANFKILGKLPRLHRRP